MRKLKFGSGLLCMALFAASASAIPIGVDGLWGDWFSSVPNASQLNDNEWSNADGLRWTVKPGVGYHIDDPAGDANGPGVGGQPYDAEMILWTSDTSDPNHNRLYIGLVTGFNPAGETSGAGAAPDDRFDAGDMFLDFGNDGSYEIAVGTSTADSRAGKMWAEFDANGLETENVFYSQHWSANPYRAAAGEPLVDSLTGTTPSTALFASHFYGPKHRYFYEICIDFGTGVFTGDPIGLHWTMECGNDYINDVIPTGGTPLNPVPVPAAAPMVLLGMGVIGFARRARRAKKA